MKKKTVILFIVLYSYLIGTYGKCTVLNYINGRKNKITIRIIFYELCAFFFVLEKDEDDLKHF